jgi:hypothetical protein
MVIVTILKAHAGDTTAQRDAQTHLHELSRGDRRFAIEHAQRLIEDHGSARLALMAIAGPPIHTPRIVEVVR